MKIYRDLSDIPQPFENACVTIGNFDGVHLGHQAVLGQLVEKGAAMKLPTTLISFEPTPAEYFSQDKAPARLTTFREKFITLKRFAIDRLLVLPFNQRMASMSAEDFINSTLIEGLDIRYLVVGDDFRFGQDRTGDFELLEKTGKENNFTVVSMPSFRIDDERVSSSGIRSALADGDFNRAERLLGRPYHMAGKVAHGDKRGRQWGFPTANINMKRKVIPLRGIFAVEVFGLDHEPVFGVANLGTRPTVGGMRTLLEVHLFDFDEEIYGRRINVLFRHKIREEVRFDSFDELKAQIALDVISAREYFSAI
ncbi:MAG: bifunctional riboflavin kinase/FAD synthetase [Gammaproteobacteria bacterium]|nr:bifunctional riboflavin kinase/FAD synthetase [Gammaproteobacteria bacterium]